MDGEEIDRILVSLLGDTSSLEDAMNLAVNVAGKTEKELSDLEKKVYEHTDAMGVSIKDMVSNANKVLGTLGDEIKFPEITPPKNLEDVQNQIKGVFQTLNEFAASGKGADDVAGITFIKTREALEELRSTLDKTQPGYAIANAAIDEHVSKVTQMHVAYLKSGEEAKRLQQNTTEAFQKMAQSMQETGRSLVMIGGTIAGVFGLMIHKAVMASQQYEVTEVAFATMMGSAEKASKMLADVKTFAAKTPFEIPEIQQVARGLIQFGETQEQVTNTLTLLGNAASGTSSSFAMVGTIFNQVRGVGKLMTGDFRQLSTRGVLSLQDIAKHYGVTTAAAERMISRGKVSFEDFRKVLEGLSAEGGRFNNMMEKQSQTLDGLKSNFADAKGQMSQKIGDALLPFMKELYRIGIKVAEWLRDLPPEVHTAIAVFGGMAVGIGTLIAGLGALLVSAGSIINALISLKAIITALNLKVLLSTAALQGYGAALLLVTKAVAVLAAAYVGFKAGQALAEKFNIGGLKDYQEEMERTTGVNMAMKMQLQKRFDDAFDKANQGTDAEKKTGLSAELERMNLEMQGYKRNVKDAEAEMARLAPTWLSLGQAGKAMHEAAKVELEHHVDRLKMAEAHVGKLTERYEILTGLRGGPEVKPEDQAAADKRLEDLKLEAATLGMLAEEKTAYIMKTKNLSEALIEETVALEKGVRIGQEFFDNVKKISDAKKEAIQNATDMTKALTEELAVIRMSEKEKHLYSLTTGLVGLSKDSKEYKAAEAAYERLDLEKKKKLIEDTNIALKDQITTVRMTENEKKLHELKKQGVDPNSTEFKESEKLLEQLDAEQKAFAKKQRQIEEGKQITLEFATAEEKYIAKATEYKELLDKGLISHGAHGRLMKQLGEGFASAKQEADKATDGIKGFKDELDSLYNGSKKFHISQLGLEGAIDTAKNNAMGSMKEVDQSKTPNRLTQGAALEAFTNMNTQLQPIPPIDPTASEVVSSDFGLTAPSTDVALETFTQSQTATVAGYNAKDQPNRNEKMAVTAPELASVLNQSLVELQAMNRNLAGNFSVTEEQPL